MDYTDIVNLLLLILGNYSNSHTTIWNSFISPSCDTAGYIVPRVLNLHPNSITPVRK